MKQKVLAFVAMLTLAAPACQAQSFFNKVVNVIAAVGDAKNKDKKVIDAGGQVALNLPKDIANRDITNYEWKIGNYDKLRLQESNKYSATFLGIASTPSVVVTYKYKYKQGEKVEEGSYAFTIVINQVYPTAINIDQEVTVGWGISKYLPLYFSPKYSEAAVSYDSDNTNVVTVGSDGKIFGVSLGEANISMRTENGLSTSTHVYCVVPAVNKITVYGNNKKQKLYPGDEVQLYYKFTPEHAQPEIHWSSSDTQIATVDDNGLVKIVGNGTVHIYCTSKSGVKDDVKLKPKKAKN